MISRELNGLPLSEIIALLKLGSGDPRSSAAAVEILRRFRPLLRKYWAWHRLGEFDDFVQETMVRLFVALPNLRSAEAFPGLFRRIVIGTATDTLRAPRSETVDLAEVDEARLAIEFDESLSTGVVVRSYLEHLPQREREVLEMLFFDDIDPAEAAMRLSITEGAVRTTKSRALGRIRLHLDGDRKKT